MTSSDALYSLAYSFGSFITATSSIYNLPSEARIPLQKGIFLISLGFIYFTSLTTFFNKLLLETASGIRFQKKYNLSVYKVLDISNKLVSGVQAIFSSVAGLLVCKYSCTRNFIRTSYHLSEAYAYFAAPYFIYDMWSMYVVFSTKTREKLKNASNGTQDTKPTNTNGCNTSHCNFPSGDVIPSLKNGQLSWFRSNKNGMPSFLYWISKSPLMVFHHLFIGWYGLLVITYLRGALGDCVLSFFYIMELSTPFVSLRSILATMNLKETRLYVINGLTMVAFFFIFRICIVPYAFYWYASFSNIGIFEAIGRLPIHCKISIISITLPQFYWFKLMVNGAIKVFKPKK
ncbi:TLC domain-containing protein 3A [Culicoides brevitarsis]|uniref:TLC domain-containing protein 3A n=1 Tax=Culicoides brevitarsis TaxID=469753 RepID=UPI00307B545A